MSTPALRRGNRFRVHWTQERIIEAIQEWRERYHEPPRRTDWDPTRCEKLADAALVKADEWRKRATLFRIGEWPTPRTVTEAFGSWNNAIEAAGLTPRLPSQRTARATEPSHFLTPLGHAMTNAYQAEDTGDVETLRIALHQVAAVATDLARQLEADEDTLALALDGKP
jgi:Homing endonuclease associated repeat